MADRWKEEARAELETKLGVCLEKLPGDKEWVYETMRARAKVLELESRLSALQQSHDRLLEALIRLRDCDWVITPANRMDAVRDIARAAIAAIQVAEVA